MFFWNRKEKEEEEQNTFYSDVDEDVVTQPIYLISENDKPLIYKKEKEDAISFVNGLKDQRKFELTCGLKTVFTEWDEGDNFCRIYSKDNICFYNYEKLETVFKIQRVVNL
jgi:hypothetical protein